MYSGGAAGLAWLFGPTGGYLLAFPVAAYAMGAVAARGGFVRALLGAALGMVIIHLGGVAQLAVLTGDFGAAVRLGSLPFLSVNHPLAYTAQEIAAHQHVSGKEMAKVVMLEADELLVMGVIPGSRKISLERAKASLGANMIRLATEEEFIARFPECEIGAMPPFGSLFGLHVFVDPELEKDEYIYFNAGNHVQTVRLKYKDFQRLVEPQSARLIAESKKEAA